MAHVRAKRDSKVSRIGLYPSEAEVARRLSIDMNRWRATAPILEHQGLPRIDPLFGGRYWPAVQAFMDRRHGLDAATSYVMDGEENLSIL